MLLIDITSGSSNAGNVPLELGGILPMWIRTEVAEDRSGYRPVKVSCKYNAKNQTVTHGQAAD